MRLDKKGKLVIEEKHVRKQVKGYLKQAYGFFCAKLKDLPPMWQDRVLKDNVPLAILWWNHQGLGSYRGISDLEGYCQGHHFNIEVKKPTGKLSKEQELFVAIARNHNDKIFVAYSFEAFKMEFDGWAKQIKEGRI